MYGRHLPHSRSSVVLPPSMSDRIFSLPSIHISGRTLALLRSLDTCRRKPVVPKPWLPSESDPRNARSYGPVPIWSASRSGATRSTAGLGDLTLIRSTASCKPSVAAREGWV